MANLIWEYNNTVVSGPIDLGAMEHLTETTESDIFISHDSKLEITDCGFYISPYSKEYSGSFSPRKDYERVLWLADNYPGFGLSIRQEYEVTGQLNGHDGIRLIDYGRNERTDIFKGATIEILSGDGVGETATIESYNVSNQVFILSGNFSTNVKNANYKILINKEDFINASVGSSYETMIPLVYKGGAIERLDVANIKLKLRIPKFAQSSGTFLFDFRMQYTSLEEN